jgi:hypothetical protein
VSVGQKFGWELAGAWETAMVNDSEAFALWAIPSWEAWAEFEKAQRRDAEIVEWRRRLGDLALDWKRILLVDAPLCPFRTGRQPSRDDRVDYEEL